MDRIVRSKANNRLSYSRFTPGKFIRYGELKMAHATGAAWRHKLDEILNSMRDNELTDALIFLELVATGSGSEKRDRLRRRVYEKEYNEDDFNPETSTSAELDQERRDKALQNYFTGLLNEDINGTDLENLNSTGDSQIELLEIADTRDNNVTRRKNFESNMSIRDELLQVSGSRSNSRRPSFTDDKLSTRSGQSNAREPPFLVSVNLQSGEKIAIPDEVIRFWSKKHNEEDEQDLIHSVLNGQTTGHPLAQSMQNRSDNTRQIRFDTLPRYSRSQEDTIEHYERMIEKLREENSRLEREHLHSTRIESSSSRRRTNPPIRSEIVQEQSSAQNQAGNLQQPRPQNPINIPPVLQNYFLHPQLPRRESIDQNEDARDRGNDNVQDTLNPQNEPTWTDNRIYENPRYARDISKTVAAWKLSFSGSKNDNIEEFLRRVNEHREVAALSDREMLRAIPLLLTQPALNLYRIKKDTWRTWAEFEADIRKQYRDDYYSEKKADEIRARFQKPDEPVSDYITEMQFIYSQMTTPPSEQAQVERIYRNMRPEFLPLLHPYVGLPLNIFIEQAIKLGKAFEAGQQYKAGNSVKACTDPKINKITANEGENPNISAVTVPTTQDVTDIIRSEINKLKDTIFKIKAQRGGNLSKNQDRSNQSRNNSDYRRDGNRSQNNNNNYQNGYRGNQRNDNSSQQQNYQPEYRNNNRNFNNESNPRNQQNSQNQNNNYQGNRQNNQRNYQQQNGQNGYANQNHNGNSNNYQNRNQNGNNRNGNYNQNRGNSNNSGNQNARRNYNRNNNYNNGNSSQNNSNNRQSSNNAQNTNSGHGPQNAQNPNAQNLSEPNTNNQTNGQNFNPAGNA